MKLNKMGIPEGNDEQVVEWYLQNSEGFRKYIKDFVRDELKKEKPNYLDIQKALYDLGKLETVVFLKEKGLTEHVDKIL
jgi:hypothetical protein